MDFQCSVCKTRFVVPDDKVADRPVPVLCPACGKEHTVDPAQVAGKLVAELLPVAPRLLANARETDMESCGQDMMARIKLAEKLTHRTACGLNVVCTWEKDGPMVSISRLGGTVGPTDIWAVTKAFFNCAPEACIVMPGKNALIIKPKKAQTAPKAVSREKLDEMSQDVSVKVLIAPSPSQGGSITDGDLERWMGMIFNHAQKNNVDMDFSVLDVKLRPSTFSGIEKKAGRTLDFAILVKREKRVEALVLEPLLMSMDAVLDDIDRPGVVIVYGNIEG